MMYEIERVAATLSVFGDDSGHIETVVSERERMLCSLQFLKHVLDHHSLRDQSC